MKKLHVTLVTFLERARRAAYHPGIGQSASGSFNSFPCTGIWLDKGEPVSEDSLDIHSKRLKSIYKANRVLLQGNCSNCKFRPFGIAHHFASVVPVMKQQHSLWRTDNVGKGSVLDRHPENGGLRNLKVWSRLPKNTASLFANPFVIPFLFYKYV